MEYQTDYQFLFRSKQHKQISANVEDVVLLLQNTMSSGRETVAGMRRAQDSMKCFQVYQGINK